MFRKQFAYLKISNGKKNRAQLGPKVRMKLTYNKIGSWVPEVLLLSKKSTFVMSCT